MGWAFSLRLMAAEDVLSLAALVMILLIAWLGDRSARAMTWLAVLAIAGSALFVIPDLTSGAMGPGVSGFYGQYSADAFASFAKILIDISAIASLLVAPAFFARVAGGMRPEYPLLLLLAVLGMGLMVSATNLITLYIGLELNSLASYVLAAMLRSDERSAEAGLKYFVLGALASGILLFGMSLVYGFAGSVDFLGLRAALHGPVAVGAIFGITFMFAGLAFKISAVPFHMWTPDVYEGAPTPVTTFFATAAKTAALAMTMRVALMAFGREVHAWQQVVIFAALASIIVGALGAIGQTNIKRLLAYSSINNVGFILIGLACATPGGAAAMLTYMAIYVAMSVGSFLVVLMMKDETGEPVESIADLAGLSRHRKVLALCFAMVMFALAGIPPLFGFWGKFVVFQAAVSAGLVPLAAIGIAASVIGAFYYLKIVKIMYFDEPAMRITGKSDALHQAILLLSAVAISPLGYLATKWLAGVSYAAATGLFAVG
ncbi:MAG: NADH-quinone oxidoreductase subunit NuoN [Sphingomonadales bacterium]|nr:NADH-quinone oxidoreductase subunit NuoN [Sphingomonadales bacterium]